ncbi:Tetratricopeptide repeat protein 37-like [Homarus americanus]|uniref:Tetratricopeptide repeat protein 37-like n=1 Tax=Homarus americanus TaxID=6706 RepID=A0A8J5MYM9_HOMAM|nr:Tetratricopeptide repeat protein 37-like [Homarus americanus]
MSVMNEVKFALRDAKKAMKENDFEAVAKHCKTALKYDRKNYNALLLFGRACQELGKLEDSKKALMMATQVDSESPVAWQGLAMLCEKQPNISTLDETITIYIRLTHIIKDDDDKVDNVYRKLAALQLKNDEPLKAAATLKLLTTKLKDHKRVQEVWRSIAQTLSGIKDLPDEHASETRQLVKLVEAARTMAEIFPTYYPLEWICRMYVLMTTNPQEDEEGYPLSSEEARTYITKLLRLNRASPWGNLAQGLVYKGEGLYIEAKAHLRVGAERVGNNLLPWKILLEIQEATNDWPGVEVSCKKSLKIMEADETITIPDDEGFEAYRTKMMLTQAKAYVIMGHKNHLRQAVDILEEHAYTSLDCGLLLVRSRIKLLEFDQTEDELLKLEEAFGEHSQLKLLRGCLLRAQGERQKAMQVLEEFVEEEPKSAEGHLELGCVYFATGELQKAQMSCMRAGKLNPKLGGPFLYLGHFYRRQDNMEKAVKCYEKALSLDPCDDQTGAALSDLYRILGKYEANINLLHRITNEGGRASCCWAWLRLGLHHLALQNYDQAIQAFQCTLKINPDDRGSLCGPQGVQLCFTSQPWSSIVGETLDAVKDYETVLKREPIKPVQVVSLIGLAEALIAAARKHYEQFFHANVKDACLRALVCLIRAASIKPESACIWKLIGDACTLLYPMPTSLSNFSIPAKLIQKDVEDLEEMTEVDKMQILQIGARCYGVALQVTKDDAMLWHDLGVNTYLQGKVLEEGVDGRNDVNTRDLMDRSVMALRKSLSLDPLNGKTWNSLGIVAAHNLVGQYALAQHALIRACEYQPNAVVWTHLGAFYLTHSEHSLAHEAFSQAQALDPSFVTCWVGQALVAEKVGHSEVFDLFRHTTLLGIQVESCVGYSHHVTNLASDSKKNTNQRTQYTIKQSLPAATDASTFYSREKEEDVIGLNMNGLTLEMMGLYQSAAKAYEMAMAAIDPDQPEMQDCLDGVRCNLGRTLTAQGKVEEAMKQFKAIKSPDYFTQCGLALASLKAGQFEDAYNGYTAALHWLAPDDTQKSHILVALASLQYKFQKSDEAKNLLFQGAALAELAPYEHHKDYLHHVAFIKAAEATARGNTKEAKSILSRTIHQHPSSAPLWRSLARHLLTTTTSTSKKISGQCSAAAMCAAAATKLSQAAGEHKTITQDAVTSVMATLGLEVSIQRNSKNKTSLKQAQRAVLMCPGSPEAWAMLVAAQIVAGHGQTDTHLAPLAKILSQKGSPQISSWLQTISTRLA